MKRLIVLTFITCLLIGVNAQDRIAVGLKAGFNSTKINLSDLPDGSTFKSEAKSGGLVGAYARLKLFGSLSVQPEVYYAKKNAGYTYTDPTSGEEVTTSGAMHTWDIPLLVNLQLFDLKIGRIYGVAGPVASFISKDDIARVGFKTSNWTLQAGGGIEFWRLTADVRYEWGLKDINDIPNFDIGQKTDVLTFTVGFKLLGI